MDLYLVVVMEDGETYQYEYGNIKHAKEHYDTEKHAQLLKYVSDNNFTMVDCK